MLGFTLTTSTSRAFAQTKSSPTRLKPVRIRASARRYSRSPRPCRVEWATSACSVSSWVATAPAVATPAILSLLHHRLNGRFTRLLGGRRRSGAPSALLCAVETTDAAGASTGALSSPAFASGNVSGVFLKFSQADLASLNDGRGFFIESSDLARPIGALHIPAGNATPGTAASPAASPADCPPAASLAGLDAAPAVSVCPVAAPSDEGRTQSVLYVCDSMSIGYADAALLVLNSTGRYHLRCRQDKLET